MTRRSLFQAILGGITTIFMPIPEKKEQIPLDTDEFEDWTELICKQKSNNKENPYTMCSAVFKSKSCGYKGFDKNCRHTYTDCFRKNNQTRFNGFNI